MKSFGNRALNPVVVGRELTFHRSKSGSNEIVLSVQDEAGVVGTKGLVSHCTRARFSPARKLVMVTSSVHHHVHTVRLWVMLQLMCKNLQGDYRGDGFAYAMSSAST